MRLAYPVTALVVLLAGTANGADAPTAPVLVLEDQFQRSHQLGAARGDVVVVIYGDRHSVDANRQLGAALHIHFHPTAQGLPPGQAGQAPVRPVADWPAGVPVPDVRVVPVACAGKVPTVIAAMIRNQLKSKSPDLPILLDLADRMKEYYGLAAGVTNLAVIDTRGRVRHRCHGPFKSMDLASLARFVEDLRLEAKVR